MLAFPAAIKIFVAIEPLDMRKQFNGLRSAAQEKLHDDSRSGAVFAFINKAFYERFGEERTFEADMTLPKHLQARDHPYRSAGTDWIVRARRWWHPLLLGGWREVTPRRDHALEVRRSSAPLHAPANVAALGRQDHAPDDERLGRVGRAVAEVDLSEDSSGIVGE